LLEHSAAESWEDAGVLVLQHVTPKACQYLYFCTSKASKLSPSDSIIRAEQGGREKVDQLVAVFVLVKQAKQAN
jgi:hypothetical protein